MISESNTWISIGDAIKVNKKELYIVAKAKLLKGSRGIMGCAISPIAVLVIEPADIYAISLTEEKITIDQLLAEAPSLKEIVEKANEA